ncbi:MAG: DUF4266 domain-containing protein [Nannocystaceae bacterium]
MKRVCIGALMVSLGLCLWPGSAWGYSSTALYSSDPASTGGAGGRVFTGSPADGLSCNVCHVGDPASQRSLVGGPGPDGYRPGETYAFSLAWPGERLAFTVEATDFEGRPFGTLTAPPRELLEPTERCESGSGALEAIQLGSRVTYALGDCGATSMRLQWTAPDEPVRGALFLGTVLADGDGTPQGDRAGILEVPLEPVGAGEGCSIAAHKTSTWPLWLVVLILTSRRRRRLLVGSLALLLPLGGCARVKPYERGRLAQPDMALKPSDDLESGPDHALDYREGSAGGLGGNGGGCGCN